MKPNKYTKNGNNITYHYTFTELRKFLEHGFKEGNNGFILVGQDDRFLRYRGFGTIEYPYKSLRTIEMENDPMLDGEMPNPEEILKPRYVMGCDPYNKGESYSYFIWDVNNKNVKLNK